MKRELDLDPDEARRAVEAALARTDAIDEYTREGGDFEGLATPTVFVGSPLAGPIGTVLRIEVDPADGEPGSMLRIRTRAARRLQIPGADRRLQHSFLAEFDDLLERKGASWADEAERTNRRTSAKRYRRLGTRQRTRWMLGNFVFPVLAVSLVLLGGALAGDLETGISPSVVVGSVLAALVLTYVIRKGLGI